MTFRAAAMGVLALAALAAGCAAPARGTTAGFWFEHTSYTSPLIGAITADDLVSIGDVARSELRAAFHGMNIALSDRRDARYRVSVVQELRDRRLKREMFTHQFLPHVPIHDSRDPATFEYGAANRPEQYFGTLRWGFAGPLLRARFTG